MKKNLLQNLVNLRDNLICTGIILFILYNLNIIFQIDFLDVVQNTVDDFYITDYASSGGFDDVGKDTNVVMVNIGHLNRREIAEEIMILSSYGPKVIGIDATFPSPKIHYEYSNETDSLPSEVLQVVGEEITPIPSESVPEELKFKIDEDPVTKQLDTFFLVKVFDTLDVYLEYALAKAGNVVLVNELKDNSGEFTFGRIQNPAQRFLRHVRTGFANVITDSTEDYRTVRYFAPFRIVGKDTVLSFALQLAKQLDPAKVGRLMARKNLKEIIRYRRNTDKYTTLDYKDVFARRDSLGFLKDKVIIMAFLGTDIDTRVTEDIFYTPMNDHYYGRCYPDMYGGVIHANILNMILDEEYIGSMDLWPEWVKVFLIVGLLVFFNMIFLNWVRIRHENWYEPLSLALTVTELIMTFVLVIVIYKYFNFEVKLKALFYAIILSGTMFETYHGSFKPIFVTYYNKLLKKKKKGEAK